jgi:hypothetical protein
VAALRELPRLDTVIVAVLAVAVNVNHSPYVVVAVAPPQAPTGAALDAFFILSLTKLQVVDGVSVPGLAQVPCPDKLMDDNVVSPKSTRTGKRKGNEIKRFMKVVVGFSEVG